MPSKAIATPANHSAARAVKSSRGSSSTVPGIASAQLYPFTQLQQSFGNQVMQQLLESGAIQAKMRISQPGDADEVEADCVAERVVRSAQAPKIQRKCSCSGQTRCATCEEEESKGIHRKTASSTDVHRSAASDQPDDAAPQSSQKHRGLSRPEHLIVDDGAEKLEHGQMRKSEFLKLMRFAVCATSDAALAAMKLTTRGCPYIEKWLAFYSEQEASHIETALTKYAPEAARARTAREYISILNVRVERAVISWGKTGKLSGVPDELANQILGGGAGGAFLGKDMRFASSGFGKSILGFLGGGSKESNRTFFEKDLGSPKKDSDGRNDVKRKESASSSGVAAAAASSPLSSASHPADASAVKSKLGSGYALDSHLRSRMSAAFAYDFSKVRVHTDSNAADLSSNLNAKAFTVGEHVAFGAGEYRPGTPVGDVLIAHELAHVIQQGGGQASAPLTKSSNNNGPLEQDADNASLNAVAALWTGAETGMASLRQNAMPRLRSGLRLQRCAGSQQNTRTAQAPGSPSATQSVQLSGNPARWREDVTLAKNAHDETAMLALVRQALGSNYQVRLAGKSNRNAIDPTDYSQAPVINFDPLMNGKRPAGGSTNLSIDNGYSFSHGSDKYVLLGPNALDPRDPQMTRMYADHELFHVAHHLPNANAHDANNETEAWTDSFVNYFHRYMDLPLDQRPVWKPLADYYEAADGPHRQAAIARLRAYLQNPPVASTEQDRVRRYVSGWVHRKLRAADFPNKALLNDIAPFTAQPPANPSRNP